MKTRTRIRLTGFKSWPHEFPKVIDHTVLHFPYLQNGGNCSLPCEYVMELNLIMHVNCLK